MEDILKEQKSLKEKKAELTQKIGRLREER